MKAQASRQSTDSAEHPQPAAFAIHINRNLVVQALGLAMVSLTSLSVLPWPWVASWTTVAAAVVIAENRLLRLMARDGHFAQSTGGLAPALRIMATSVYAVAAYMLIAKGGLAACMFAFAVISASVVHVLMRYYRTPLVMLASISPYLIVVGLVSIGLAREAIGQGHVLAALTSSFAIVLLAVQFWSARAQLSGAWFELMAAREAAEARERAADAANRAKSLFLANMSHELRTPLNGVLGMAQALSAEPLTPVQQQRVNIIRRSSEGLLSVLNGLLDLSKIEAGAVELELVDFDMEDLVNSVAGAHGPIAAEKGLSFEVEILDGVSGRYHGDSARIWRILHSLCDNAVKFTQTGGVTLRVVRDAEQVIFRISDTGIGIGDDDLAHLFEKFFQADASSTRRYGGAGVGLAVCRELAGLMGGDVEAASTLGAGSVFTLRTPLARAPAAPTPAPRTGLAGGTGPAAHFQILAAEDDPINQLVLKTLLEPAGFEPTMVDNGRAALAAWESKTWDVILMDIQMPEMNGVEAAQAIRMREQVTRRPRTPIVAVTANTMAYQIVEYEEAGIDCVVPKPIDEGELLDAIGRALAAAAPIHPGGAISTA